MGARRPPNANVDTRRPAKASVDARRPRVRGGAPGLRFERLGGVHDDHADRSHGADLEQLPRRGAGRDRSGRRQGLPGVRDRQDRRRGKRTPEGLKRPGAGGRSRRPAGGAPGTEEPAAQPDRERARDARRAHARRDRTGRRDRAGKRARSSTPRGCGWARSRCRCRAPTGTPRPSSGLLHAQVVVRSGAPGAEGDAAQPAPELTPGEREVSWAGASYRVDTFAGEAFPNRPASIALLLPSTADRSGVHGRTAPARRQAQAQTRWARWPNGCTTPSTKAAKRNCSCATWSARAPSAKRCSRATRRRREQRSSASSAATCTSCACAWIRAGTAAGGRGRPSRAGPDPRRDPQRQRPRGGPLRDGDPGRPRLSDPLAGVHRRAGADARGDAPGDGHPEPRPGHASPTAAGWSTAASTYQAYSFEAEAFPSGALRISLLYPAS